jgi:hypothetical protein
MDVLLSRSYQRPAQLNINGDIVPLQWYPVPETNPVFPFPHAFASINYRANYDEIEGVGEVDEAMTWTPDVYQPYSGLTYCGHPDWFLNGLPADAPQYLSPCFACQYPYQLLNLRLKAESIMRQVKPKLRVKFLFDQLDELPEKLLPVSFIAPQNNYIISVSTQVLVPGAYSDAYSTAYDSQHYVPAPI